MLTPAAMASRHNAVLFGQSATHYACSEGCQWVTSWSHAEGHVAALARSRANKRDSQGLRLGVLPASQGRLNFSSSSGRTNRPFLPIKTQI